MNKRGFTIVELLVVIVVIGILAAITIISFTGISQKAVVSSLQSDLSSAKKQLALYYVDHGAYPASIDQTTKCPLDSTPAADTRYCLKSSTGNSFVYSSPVIPYNKYILDSINTASSTKYRITNDSTPVSAMPTDTITIGTQTWMKYNLDVGTMITGATAQTNNSVLEKYCYNNEVDNCTIYGGLYQWNEAMQYVTTQGAQGICPSGFHVPTHSEWTTLTTYLGAPTAGTQLMSGVTSGFNGLLAGSRSTDGLFYDLSSYTALWSSLEANTTTTWYRLLLSGVAAVSSTNGDKAYGFSVRCLGN